MTLICGVRCVAILLLSPAVAADYSCVGVSLANQLAHHHHHGKNLARYIHPANQRQGYVFCLLPVVLLCCRLKHGLHDESNPKVAKIFIDQEKS